MSGIFINADRSGKSDDPRVDIAVAGKFHAYYLASEFGKLSRLRDLYSVHRTISPPNSVSHRAFHNRLDLAAWGALSRYTSLGYTNERKFEIFDQWLLGELRSKSPGILHSWNGGSLNTFKALKGSGWRLCLERSCPHNQFQYDLLVEEGKTLGIPHAQNMRALERAIEELQLADVIVTPSSYSAASYKDPDLIRKVRVNSLGGNIKYQERPKKQPGFRVLMVGNNFLRKGIHYLVEAFRLIRDPMAELWIRGDVPDVYRSRIKDARVTIIPAVLPSKLRELYLAADVFVQPSIDEGFGMTVLEALGFGLPVVITENVGSKDLLSPDVAFTVPIRDPRALADAIESARLVPGPSFDLARKAIIEMNTWAACARRMLDRVYADHGGNDGPRPAAA
jgi:glycosyltransferase involved in cell wall biosynthesis